MESTTIVNQLNQSLATPMPELSAEQKNAISWTICCTNAFVMLTSGLVIDIKKVLENLSHKRGFKSGIIIGLIGQLVLMPCMTFLAISIGKLDNAISLAVIIQGCCPGSAVLNLFSAYNDGNAILAQTLTSVGTFMAVGLMPLYLKIYASNLMDPTACENGVCPEIPYGPICRTLSILLLGLSIGITIRYLIMRYNKKLRILKMFVKFGTILGFLVIVTFIILYAIYFTWDFGKEVWIITAVMPLCGYSLGYAIANAFYWSLHYFADKRKNSYAQAALKNFTTHECRTIGLACGLQNTQLGMSTVFGAYALDDYLIEKMHPYSPLYGFMELFYAFIISGIFYLVEKFYFQEITPGPRIVDIHHHLWTQQVEKEPEMYINMKGIIDTLQRLPASFRRRNRLGTNIEEDTFEPSSLDFEKLQTVTSYYELTNDYNQLTLEGKNTVDKLMAWKQRFPEENFTRAHEIEQYVRNRKNSSTGGTVTGLEQGRYSVVTDFTKASTKRGRFEVTTEIAAESLANSPSIENQKPETSETITDSSPDTSSSNGLPSYEPYDVTDEGPQRTSSILDKKALGRSMSHSVQPAAFSKKQLQPQMSSPVVGLSSRFRITTVDELQDIKQEQESMITKNKDEGQSDNNEESPNTSAESDDVFIVEKVVEDNSEA